MSNWLFEALGHAFRRKTKTASPSRVPDGLWRKCDQCKKTILIDILQKNLSVCECGYHFRISPKERIKQVLDNGEYTKMHPDIDFKDPIQFSDVKSYKQRFESAQIKTGASEAIIVVQGSIMKCNCIVMIMDFDFIGGSMGISVGNAVQYAAEVAIEQKMPLIVFTASGGARMQEGLFSLMQMPKTVFAVEKVKNNNLPYITVLTNPTTGGVLASFGMLGSITIAESNAIIGFAGPRVIESITKVKLPDGFQTPQSVHKCGFLDAIVERKNIRSHLGKILNILST